MTCSFCPLYLLNWDQESKEFVLFLFFFNAKKLAIKKPTHIRSHRNEPLFLLDSWEHFVFLSIKCIFLDFVCFFVSNNFLVGQHYWLTSHRQTFRMFLGMETDIFEQVSYLNKIEFGYIFKLAVLWLKCILSHGRQLEFQIYYNWAELISKICQFSHVFLKLRW